MGSEMCIRDSALTAPLRQFLKRALQRGGMVPRQLRVELESLHLPVALRADPGPGRADEIKIGPFVQRDRQLIALAHCFIGDGGAGIGLEEENRRLEVGAEATQPFDDIERGQHALVGLVGKADDERKDDADAVAQAFLGADENLFQLNVLANPIHHCLRAGFHANDDAAPTRLLAALQDPVGQAVALVRAHGAGPGDGQPPADELLGDGLDAMKYYQEKSVKKNGANTSELRIDFQSEITVGTFVDRERPTFADAMNARYKEVLGPRYVPCPDNYVPPQAKGEGT